MSRPLSSKNIDQKFGSRRESNQHSDKSPSLFEEMSLGLSADRLAADDPALNRKRNRSIARLQAATYQNTIMQDNINQFLQDGEFVPELMY